MGRNQRYLVHLLLSLSTILLFQNCGQNGSITQKVVAPLDVCEGVSCVLDPLTEKPAVTTILMALGDEAEQQLVVNGASAQLIAETVIRYSSPKNNPKIIVVRDRQFNGEDPEDTAYISDVLLKRYHAKFMEEPEGGLSLQDLDGYDVVWFNNPGHPMSSQMTYNTLLQFEGAVVLQGDDLTRGAGFDISGLTGLTHMNNGTDVVCDGKVYHHDDNKSNQFRVTLNAEKFPLVDNTPIQFRYGNDIDESSVSLSKVEVLATAQGGHETCTEKRPTVVRYLK